MPLASAARRSVPFGRDRGQVRMIGVVRRSAVEPGTRIAAGHLDDVRAAAVVGPAPLVRVRAGFEIVGHLRRHRRRRASATRARAAGSVFMRISSVRRVDAACGRSDRKRPPCAGEVFPVCFQFRFDGSTGALRRAHRALAATAPARGASRTSSGSVALAGERACLGDRLRPGPGWPSAWNRRTCSSAAS